jgi:hypothetical protein
MGSTTQVLVRAVPCSDQCKEPRILRPLCILRLSGNTLQSLGRRSPDDVRRNTQLAEALLGLCATVRVPANARDDDVELASPVVSRQTKEFPLARSVRVSE